MFESLLVIGLTAAALLIIVSARAGHHWAHDGVALRALAQGRFPRWRWRWGLRHMMGAPMNLAVP